MAVAVGACSSGPGGVSGTGYFGVFFGAVFRGFGDLFMEYILDG